MVPSELFLFLVCPSLRLCSVVGGKRPGLALSFGLLAARSPGHSLGGDTSLPSQTQVLPLAALPRMYVSQVIRFYAAIPFQS